MASCSSWLPGRMVNQDFCLRPRPHQCAAPPLPRPAAVLSGSPGTSRAATTYPARPDSRRGRPGREPGGCRRLGAGLPRTFAGRARPPQCRGGAAVRHRDGAESSCPASPWTGAASPDRDHRTRWPAGLGREQGKGPPRARRGFGRGRPAGHQDARGTGAPSTPSAGQAPPGSGQDDQPSDDWWPAGSRGPADRARLAGQRKLLPYERTLMARIASRACG
jgi:hypothetical protein